MQFRLQTIVTVKLCPSRRLAPACPDLQFGKLGLLQSLCVFLPRQGERTCAAATATPAAPAINQIGLVRVKSTAMSATRVIRMLITYRLAPRHHIHKMDWHLPDACRQT